jgi:hypothetical protein
MSKFFQLWHWDSANIAGEWATLDDALDDIAFSCLEPGAEMTDDYGLLIFEDGESSLYAEGEELVRIVNERLHTLFD